MTRSIPAAKMPTLEPTIHEFVSSYEHYRKQGIMPSGWEEIRLMKRSRCWFIRRLFGWRRSNKSNNNLKEMKYSMTNMLGPGAEGIENVTMLLTLTIPNLPFRAWCPTPWCFEPLGAVMLISFEADGLMLQRVPVDSELLSSRRRTNRSATTWTRSRVEMRTNSIISSLRLPSPVSSIMERRDSVVERACKDSEFTPGMGAFDEYSIAEQKYLAFGVEPGLSEFEWLVPAITVLECKTVSKASEITWAECASLYRAAMLSEDIMGHSLS